MREKRKLFSPVRVTPYTYNYVEKLLSSSECNQHQKAIIEAFRLLIEMRKLKTTKPLMSEHDICLLLSTKHDLDCSTCTDSNYIRHIDQFR